MPATLSRERVEHMLRSWRTLHATDALNTLSEKEVESLISAELAGEARAPILLRLHGRFNTLRTRREKSELMGKVKKY